MQPSRTKQGRLVRLMVSVTGESAAWTSWRTSRRMACCQPGKGIDTGVDARVGGACHIASAPCQHRQDKRSHALARRESMAHGSGEHVNEAPLT
jgi:hypothetical protein